MKIKNITLGIPQVVCGHLSIRPFDADLDATSCNTFVEVYDKVVTPVLDQLGQPVLIDGVAQTTTSRNVQWTGNVQIPEAVYATAKNDKTVMEDYVVTTLGLERKI